MAVHGALLGSRCAQPGVLAGLRDVTLHVQRLDEIEEDLIITAEKLWAEDTRLLYSFTVRAGDTEIVRGRATVVLAQQPSRSVD
jgi:predicted hotdog family 3-hydroxylacyl-ACP dehydratase